MTVSEVKIFQECALSIWQNLHKISFYSIDHLSYSLYSVIRILFDPKTLGVSNAPLRRQEALKMYASEQQLSI